MPNPFPELAPYTEPRRTLPRGQEDGWLAEEMRRARDQEVKRTIIAAPPPEQVARETRLAREANVAPAMITGRLDEVERARNAERLTALTQRYPAMGRFVAANPRAAAIAQDDHESLGLLGTAWDTLKKTPARLWAGTIDTTAGLYEDIGNLTPTFGVAGQVQRDLLNVAGQKFAQSIRPEAARVRDANRGAGFVTEAMLSGTEFIPVSVAAAFTRNPTLATAIPALSVRGNSLAKGREQGLSGATLQTYAGLHGGIEYATERMPAGRLVEAIVKRTPIGKTIMRQLATEIPGEQAATALQDLTDWAMLPENEGKTFGEYVAARPEAALSTLISTTTGTTAQTSIAVAVERSARAASSVADRVAAARQAKEEAQVLTRMEVATKGSKTNARDPETWAALIQATAEEAGAENLWIDGEAARGYFQSDSYDPDGDPFAAYEDQAYDPSGGDVVIPIGEATKLVASPAWAALKDAMRLTQGGASKREADTFEAEMPDVLAQLTDEMAAAEETETVARTAREKLTDSIADKFGKAGLTAPVARDVATLLAQRAVARSERLGADLTGNEYDALEVRSVLPEAAKPFVTKEGGKGKVDPNFIASIKGVRGSGPSLADFIRSKGGIEDRGGDLKSMGFAALKGFSKAGQRKLIRPSAAAQGNMLGGATSDNSPERLFEAAISAGYFPNLLAQTDAGTDGNYADKADIAEFFAALENEARGEAVFSGNYTDEADGAAEGVRQELIAAGYDPAKMSKADIADVLLQMFEQDERDGYTQDLFDAENATDPAKAEAAKERLKLRAEAPLRGENKTGKAQDGSMGLGLFDSANQRSLFQAAYHGSPHIFDRFSLDKIGTGEGAQSYGYGLYFAGKKEIAEFYRRNLSGGENIRIIATYQGKSSTDWLADSFEPGNFANKEMEATTSAILAVDDELMRNRHRDYTHQSGETFEVKQHQLDVAVDKILKRPSTTPEVAAVLEKMRGRLTAKGTREVRGRLYEVEIPEDNEYLLHDRPLDEQPAKVRAALDDALAKANTSTKEVAEIVYEDGDEGKLTGQQIYDKLVELVAAERSKLEPEFGTVVWERADKLASTLLQKSGVAGIKYLDGGSRKDGAGSFNYVIFDDNAVSIRAYEQEYGDAGARGRIIFDQNRAIIELFSTRNLSTALHELSHLWLEELRFDASDEMALPSVKQDWQIVQDWFAANGHPISENGQIPTEAHELFARGGERYLMEGKAPSAGLTRLFETFRGWLTAIYKTVEKLRAPITPEIRGVFDRLLATDEEIAAANERQNLAALFKTAADMAMGAQEFEAYQAQVADARNEASGKLLDKTMRSVRFKATKAWNEERAGLIETITAEVDEAPLYRALRAMKTERINAGWVTGEGFDIAQLPVRVPPLTKPGGADPELIAELSGFATGREMIETLVQAEATHLAAKEGGDPRSMRQRTIEDQADAEMNRRHGDALNDGSIEREALEAVHNDKQGEVIATELRVLSRTTGQRPTPYALAKDWARNRVRSGTVRDEASPSAIQRYARAAAKAGKAAQDAMLKGDADETFRQKQFQLLNNALVSEAKAAHDEVNAAVKRMGRVAKAQTMASVDQDYLEQAQALLEEVDLRRRSQVSQDRKESFEAWAQRKLDAGEEVYLPPRFDYQGTNYTRLPVETLIALDDTVKSILHIGRRKKELKLGKEKRDYEEARGEWLQAAEPLAERPVIDDRNPQPSKVRGLFSNFVRIDMMAKIMDGGDPNGLMTRALAYGAKEADNTYARLQKQVMEPIIDAYMAMKGNRLHERVSVPEWTDYRTGGPSTFLRSDLMAIAQNLGNESSLRKMIAGEALLFKGREELAPTLEGIEQMLARELNEAEWKMVELNWRKVDSMFPEIAADERERTGITPEKVEPRMVQTPFGEVEGGYWPAVYDSDPARTAAAGINLAEYKAGDLETTLGLTGKGVSTAKGHTITRTDFVAPMYLNLEGVLFGHVNQVAKRIAYQGWGQQALKIIRDPRIKAMWARKLGEEYHDQLEPWLRDTINQGVVANTGHLAAFNGILKTTRMNLTIMGLVGRITTLVAQIGGLTSSVNAIGARNMMNGIAICAADYGANKGRIFEASPLMARRISEFDRDQAAALAELSRPRTSTAGRVLKPVADLRDRWNAFGFHMIGAVQLHLVDLPTWAGAYAQATGASENGGLDMDHDAAVSYADMKVEQAQGAARPAQLAAVQRAGEASRIMTLFYTFFGTQLNFQWEMTQDIRNNRYGKATKAAFWIMVATPLLGGLLADAIRGDLPDGEDDDTWLAWMMRKVFFGMFNNVPIVRDFSSQMERKAAGKFAPDPTTPWTRLIGAVAGGGKDAFAGVSQTDWYQDAERLMPFLPDPQEVSDKWVKHAIEALGFATGTGLGQVATTGQFVAEVESGDADPEGAGDWMEGIVTGRVKEPS